MADRLNKLRLNRCNPQPYSPISISDEAMADEAMADETMVDEAVADEAMVDEAMADGSFPTDVSLNESEKLVLSYSTSHFQIVFYVNRSSDSTNSTRMISPLDVACALVLFKRRFRLSISCIDHLLKLLPHIPCKSVPTSWSALKTLLRKTTVSSPPTVTFICPTCSKNSSSKSICSDCGAPMDASSSITSFRNFNITNQLHRIISTNYQHINFEKKSNKESMRDICDGDVYRRLQDSCSDSFITLSMNIDGIQPNKGSKTSIWPIILIVNELPMRRRFSPENLILAGVWPGPKKPSRSQMTFFLSPLIAELVRLENGEVFFIPSCASSPLVHRKCIRIYLIGACCDKPAQCLVQNLPEPTAAFGCGRCELEGRFCLCLYFFNSVSNKNQSKESTTGAVLNSLNRIFNTIFLVANMNMLCSYRFHGQDRIYKWSCTLFRR